MFVCARSAQVVLHDPHVDLHDPHDPSLVQISRASQAILELMYSLSATSYDISLLNQMVFVRAPARYRSVRAG